VNKLSERTKDPKQGEKMKSLELKQNISFGLRTWSKAPGVFLSNSGDLEKRTHSI
jgi:hypothetical protein